MLSELDLGDSELGDQRVDSDARGEGEGMEVDV